MNERHCFSCGRVVKMELLETRKIYYGSVEYWIDKRGHRITEWRSP